MLTYLHAKNVSSKQYSQKCVRRFSADKRIGTNVTNYELCSFC